MLPRLIAALLAATDGVVTDTRVEAANPVVLESNAAYTVSVGDQFYGAVAAGPGEYFAVWVDLRVGGVASAGYDLYAQRIRPDGSIVAPGSIELLRDAARMTTGVPAVGWNGAEYLVTWYEGATLYGMRVGPDGMVLDAGGFVIGSHTGKLTWPSIASDGSDFLVVQASGSAIQGFRVGVNGAILDPAPIAISSDATGVGYPKVAFGAGVYMVAWTQAPSQAIRAARVTSGGQVLDPGGINVSGGGTDVDAHIDFDGTNFFVDWQRATAGVWNLWGARVSPVGQVVSGPTLLLSGAWGAISGGQVAFNGTNHVIAITTNEPVFSNTDAYALMVSGQGTAIGAPIPVCTLDARSQRSYGMASLAGQFLMIWEANYVSGTSYVYDTQAARIDGTGYVLDRPNPLELSTSAAWQVASSTSYDGTNFLCVFEDWREGKPTYQPDLYAIRVSQEGQPLDANAIRVARGPLGQAQHAPDATFGGGQHAIVYENAAGAVNEVRMARVLPDGTMLDPNGLLVFANQPTGDAIAPKIAWNGQRYCAIWYDDYLFPGELPLQFAFVNTDGTIQLSARNIPNSDYGAPDGFGIGSNGSDFAVAWVDFDSIDLTRIAATGTVLGTQVVAPLNGWIASQPKVGFNGQSYLIAWSQWADAGVSVYARRVAAGGLPVGGVITVVGPFDQAAPIRVLAIGSDFFVVGSYRIGTNMDLFSVRIDANGVPVGPASILAGFPSSDIYAGSSVAIGPGGAMLAVHSLWTGNPYNAPRTQGQSFCLAPQVGDIDGDCVVNTSDADAFVAVLLGLDRNPDHVARADLDGDGNANGGDIQPLVIALLSH